MFYLLLDLQGSQTGLDINFIFNKFYLLLDLQGSQTEDDIDSINRRFYLLLDLQGSQTSKFTLRLSPNRSYWYMCNQNSIRQLLSSKIYVCS